MKYKLTKESIEKFGKKLFRIEALKDFGDVKKGSEGGYVEKIANLSQDDDCWIYGKAMVYGNAEVSGNAMVYDNAMVYGNAEVSGNAMVYDNAEVYGNAIVSGNAWVFGNAWVYGNARVGGNAKVSGNAKVYGNAEVSGNAWVSLCKEGINISNLPFNVTITKLHTRIGCQELLHEDMLKVTLKEALDLGISSEKEFNTFKNIILPLIEYVTSE